MRGKALAKKVRKSVQHHGKRKRQNGNSRMDVEGGKKAENQYSSLPAQWLSNGWHN